MNRIGYSTAIRQRPAGFSHSSRSSQNARPFLLSSGEYERAQQAPQHWTREIDSRMADSRLGGLTSAEKKEKRRADAKQKRANRTESQKKVDMYRNKIKHLKDKIKKGDVAATAELERVMAALNAMGERAKAKPRGRPPKSKIVLKKSKSRSKSRDKRKSKSRSRSSSRTRLERAPTIPLPQALQDRLDSIAKSRSLPIAKQRSLSHAKPRSLPSNLKYAMIVRPKSKTSQQERLAYALVPRRPSLKAVSSRTSRKSKASSRKPASVDYKSRHERCEKDLLQVETDLAKMQEQLELATEKQNKFNELALKDLELIVKRSNALIKKLK
jgi:hypothetical protein